MQYPHVIYSGGIIHVWFNTQVLSRSVYFPFMPLWTTRRLGSYVPIVYIYTPAIHPQTQTHLSCTSSCTRGRTTHLSPHTCSFRQPRSDLHGHAHVRKKKHVHSSRRAARVGAPSSQTDDEHSTNMRNTQSFTTTRHLVFACCRRGLGSGSTDRPDLTPSTYDYAALSMHHSSSSSSARPGISRAIAQRLHANVINVRAKCVPGEGLRSIHDARSTAKNTQWNIKDTTT